MQWLPGMAIYLVLAVPWFLAGGAAQSGLRISSFIHEHFDRFLTTDTAAKARSGIFVPILLLGFLPGPRCCHA